MKHHWQSSGVSWAQHPGTGVQCGVLIFTFTSQSLASDLKFTPWSGSSASLNDIFLKVWRVGLCVSNHLLPSLGPCETRNFCHNDLKHKRNQFDKLHLLSTQDANQPFPGWKAYYYIDPSCQVPQNSPGTSW